MTSLWKPPTAITRSNQGCLLFFPPSPICLPWAFLVGKAWTLGTRLSRNPKKQQRQRNNRESSREWLKVFLNHGARSIETKFQPVRPGKVLHLKRWTRFFETFPVGLNRSIEFWTEISGNSRPWSADGGALRHETTELANFLQRTLYMTPQTVYGKTEWRTN